MTNDALRRQEALPPGVRPGSLAEPVPQRSDRSLRHSSVDALPTLIGFLPGLHHRLVKVGFGVWILLLIIRLVMVVIW